MGWWDDCRRTSSFLVQHRLTIARSSGQRRPSARKLRRSDKPPRRLGRSVAGRGCDNARRSDDAGENGGDGVDLEGGELHRLRLRGGCRLEAGQGGYLRENGCGCGCERDSGGSLDGLGDNSGRCGCHRNGGGYPDGLRDDCRACRLCLGDDGGLVNHRGASRSRSNRDRDRPSGSRDDRGCTCSGTTRPKSSLTPITAVVVGTTAKAVSRAAISKL